MIFGGLGETTPITDFITADSCLSNFEIDRIRQIYDEQEEQGKSIRAVTGDESVLRPDYRRCTVQWMDHAYSKKYRCQDVISRIHSQLDLINQEIFKFDLQFAENFQVTKYSSETQDFFVPHTDCGGHQPNVVRKLTFVIQLSDLDEFEGGDFMYYNDDTKRNVTQMYPEQMERGRIIVFPSFVTHGVTPVTKGTRYSLVGWCSGPRFR